MLDDKDTLILDFLQKDGRMTAKNLAEKVSLSIPATAERIKKLVEGYYIKGFHATVHPKKLGFDVTSFILVVMASSDHYEDFVYKAEESKEVLECHSVTGEGSHLLKIRTQNTSSLESLLEDIQSWSGVIRTHTMVVMTTFKEGNQLDLRADD
jgi:Lrp/AsnC family leucine-responsive transcriptional regulator|tara:strand:+ start:13902 stop:14360 length:459 start_codon:yes stop_codon:yes gene_type:complete